MSFNCLLFSFKEICKIFRPSLCKTYLSFLEFLQFTSIACQLVPILIINGVTLALLLAFQFDALPFLLLSFLGLLLRPGLVLLLRGSRTFSPWPNARLSVLFQLTLSRLLSDFVPANKNSSLALRPILRQKDFLLVADVIEIDGVLFEERCVPVLQFRHFWQLQQTESHGQTSKIQICTPKNQRVLKIYFPINFKRFTFDPQYDITFVFRI